MLQSFVTAADHTNTTIQEISNFMGEAPPSGTQFFSRTFCFTSHVEARFYFEKAELITNINTNILCRRLIFDSRRKCLSWKTTIMSIIIRTKKKKRLVKSAVEDQLFWYIKKTAEQDELGWTEIQGKRPGCVAYIPNQTMPGRVAAMNRYNAIAYHTMPYRLTQYNDISTAQHSTAQGRIP